jgi:beta-glucosidase
MPLLFLMPWYGGEEGGSAIAETLSGANNPSGRLPVTFYRSVTQLPPFDDYAMLRRTYRYFTGDPLYRFGYGLSYSTFRYSGLRVNPDPQSKSLLHVAAQVENTSLREGAEVVQLYVGGGGQPTSDVPIRRLCSFQRIQLAPGEKRTVAFELSTERTATKVPEIGSRIITVGGGQPLGETSQVETVF